MLAKHLGVRFIYEDGASDTDKKSIGKTGYELEFADMDEAWISNLRKAATEADSNKIKDLARFVHEKNPGLETLLIEMADSFDHDSILVAIGRKYG